MRRDEKVPDGELTSAPPVVTFTSDFGTGSPYVAAMKAVVLYESPTATLIDISHAVPPYDVRIGAFALWAGTRHFNVSSVHLAVVDPGVGTERRALAIEAGGRYYVGPDNGIFELVLEHLWPWTAVSLQRSMLASRTFEGRDVFAPAAAALAAGARLGELGAPVSDLVRLPIGDSVLWVDAFGNLVTSLKPPLRGIRLAGERIMTTAPTYGEANPDEPFWYVGSMGYVEIGIPGARADERLGAGVGAIVEPLR